LHDGFALDPNRMHHTGRPDPIGPGGQIMRVGALPTAPRVN
jgi:hypothetical protein